MAPNVLYTSCVLGAIAVYLLLRPGHRAVKTFAILIGLGTLGWVAKEVASVFGTPGQGAPTPFFTLFSLIAISAAIRMITHHRPVYAALFFVMVVLSSAGLFLLLDAEFMAFALIIVYAGAILITYLFVLMLAQQAPVPGEEQRQAEYDVIPREPAAAVTVGFLMLALLTETIAGKTDQLPPPPSAEQHQVESWTLLNALPDRVETAVKREIPDFIGFGPDGPQVRVVDGQPYVDVMVEGAARPQQLALPADAWPQNIELVGLALIATFPVSLELAGVILLLAMYGAVVLARRQIEHVEAQKRAAAGGAVGGMGGAAP